jgi:hypothetical protein
MITRTVPIIQNEVIGAKYVNTLAKSGSAILRGPRSPENPIFTAIKAMVRLSIKKYNANNYLKVAKYLPIIRNNIVKLEHAKML